MPIRYENVGSSTNEENVENVAEEIQVDSITTVSSEENWMTQEVSQESALRTYRPAAALNFNMSTEEEEIMEWMHLEPPTRQHIEREDESTNTGKSTLSHEHNNNYNCQKNSNKENNQNAVIKALRIENLNLHKKIKHLKFQLRCMAQTCKELKEKEKKDKIKKNPNQEKQKKQMVKKMIQEQKLHPVAKTMMQLQLHTPRVRYTEEEKMLSKQLYYYSTSAFCRLRKAGCNFPGQRTIRRWVEEFNIKPGFCDIIFQKLKEKISEIPEEERVCALKWDEMSIKSYEEYSMKFDEIEGLVDLGPLGRTAERTKCVFVFCLDSLNAHHPWRQPLAYFLPGKCIRSHQIISLLKICLDKLNATGANVKLVTCDQGTNNQAAYRTLGVDEKEPYFIYNTKKYYASFDFPHIVKRLTSFLRTHGKIYCNGEVIVSYFDFDQTWEIDNATKGGSNLLSHITRAHIRPNCFETMNVKRAFQLFSHRYAAAIRIAGEEGELKSDTWKASADFAERLNSVIDACNSYNA